MTNALLQHSLGCAEFTPGLAQTDSRSHSFVSKCLDPRKRLLQASEEVVIGGNSFIEELAMSRWREILSLEFGPHPVEHIDVTGIEHRPHFSQGKSE